MNNERKTFVILSPGFPENEADSTCLPLQQSFIRSLKDPVSSTGYCHTKLSTSLS
jgi:hypothetical protein